MIKSFRDEPPAADQRIAQNQGGVVPNEAVARRRGVNGSHGDKDGQGGEGFLHGEIELDRVSTLGV